MSDYSKLVKTLRSASVVSTAWGKLMAEAADAIEALLESVGMLDNQRSYWIDKAAEYYNQLPKRGEWVEENRRPRSSQFVCSECHRTAYDPQPTRDKAWKKRCRYAYCPNCGAKMEVQDDDT